MQSRYLSVPYEPEEWMKPLPLDVRVRTCALVRRIRQGHFFRGDAEVAAYLIGLLEKAATGTPGLVRQINADDASELATLRATVTSLHNEVAALKRSCDELTKSRDEARAFADKMVSELEICQDTMSRMARS